MRLISIILLVCFLSPMARADETVVTHYIVTTQKERHDTRWTLTEWLRIKERMKLMDVWLAMFSDPQKDQFRPEIILGYQGYKGVLDIDGKAEFDVEGHAAKGQLWLTNLVSSTVGVRTLNIDLGLEGGGFFSERANGLTFVGKNVTYGAANFRIFGKSIQDSMMVLKAGRYAVEGPGQTKEGTMAGAEMSLYLLKWLGLEGSVQGYFSETFLKPGEDFNGYYGDYSAFIEIALIRFTLGKYSYHYTTEDDVNIKQDGMTGGVKLYF